MVLSLKLLLCLFSKFHNVEQAGAHPAMVFAAAASLTSSDAAVAAMASPAHNASATSSAAYGCNDARGRWISVSVKHAGHLVFILFCCFH